MSGELLLFGTHYHGSSPVVRCKLRPMTKERFVAVLRYARRADPELYARLRRRSHDYHRDILAHVAERMADDPRIITFLGVRGRVRVLGAIDRSREPLGRVISISANPRGPRLFSRPNLGCWMAWRSRGGGAFVMRSIVPGAKERAAHDRRLARHQRRLRYTGLTRKERADKKRHEKQMAHWVMPMMGNIHGILGAILPYLERSG